MKKIRTILQHTVIINIGLCILYVIAAKLSLRLAFVNASASSVWPPTGIAIASFLIFGPRVWPAVFFGAFLTNVTTAGTIITSLFIGLGNMLEGALGGYLTKRFAHGLHAFEKPKTVFLFTLLGALLAPIISATIGVTALSIAGFSSWNLYGPVWFTWWLGDASGALIITPVIILWYTQEQTSIRGHILDIVLFTITLVAISTIVFSGTLPYAYLIMPVLLWCAFKFGPREVASAVLLVATIGVWATLHGQGPFARYVTSPNESLLLLQLFLGVLATTKLTIAATVLDLQQTLGTLGERERRFRALIQKSTDGIVLIDPNATVLYASPSTERILGYTVEELVGIAGLSIVHPDDLDRVMKVLNKIASTPNFSINDQFRVKRKDGSWIWVETTTRNLLHDSAVGALVLNYRDITERKKLEQAKDEFMMISAHHLRSPLSSMRWNMELLLAAAKELPSSFKKKLQLIYEYNQRMIDLVNELLDVSRIIQGNIPTETEPTDIIALIQKEIDVQKPLAAKQGIKIVGKKSQKKIPILYLDSKRFSWVIQNLLSNAIKYSDKNQTITVESSLNDTHIRISVADGGIGIPKEEQANIFSKFFRASNARAVEVEGTGLGLFAVKQYIEHWGGAISVESPTQEKGRGTTIHISLPLTLTTYKKLAKGGGTP